MTHNTIYKQPSECQNIDEVRREIDRIDCNIIALLSERLGYVREVVKYKDNTESGIAATERREQVLSTRGQWAEEGGLDPAVVANLYDQLIDYFISEEKKLI